MPPPIFRNLTMVIYTKNGVFWSNGPLTTKIYVRGPIIGPLAIVLIALTGDRSPLIAKRKGNFG
jgi:hypothetical protein